MEEEDTAIYGMYFAGNSEALNQLSAAINDILATDCGELLKVEALSLLKKQASQPISVSGCTITAMASPQSDPE